MSFKLTCDLDLNQFSNQQLINLQNQLTRVIKKRLLKSDPDHVKVTVNLYLKRNYLPADRLSDWKKGGMTQKNLQKTCLGRGTGKQIYPETCSAQNAGGPPRGLNAAQIKRKMRFKTDSDSVPPRGPHYQLNCEDDQFESQRQSYLDRALDQIIDKMIAETSDQLESESDDDCRSPPKPIKPTIQQLAHELDEIAKHREDYLGMSPQTKRKIRFETDSNYEPQPDGALDEILEEREPDCQDDQLESQPKSYLDRTLDEIIPETQDQLESEFDDDHRSQPKPTKPSKPTTRAFVILDDCLADSGEWVKESIEIHAKYFIKQCK